MTKFPTPTTFDNFNQHVSSFCKTFSDKARAHVIFSNYMVHIKERLVLFNLNYVSEFVVVSFHGRTLITERMIESTATLKSEKVLPQICSNFTSTFLRKYSIDLVARQCRSSDW